VTETPPTSPDGGQWSPAVISPAQVQITALSEGTPIEVIVTNTLVQLFGAFTIEKVVDNPDGVAYDDGFEGGWQCSAAPDGTGIIGSGTWSLQAGEVSDPIEAPVGAWCAVSEAAPTAPAGGEWEPAAIAPELVQITAESAQTPIAVTVTNTLTRLLGAFTVTKTVTGDDAPQIAFEGSWSCSIDGTVVAAGSWTLAAGQTSDPFAAAVGSTCTVTEARPSGGAGTWAEPEISPASAVITSGSALAPLTFAVANRFTENGDVSPDSPDLPATGGAVSWWAIGLGAVLLVAGAAVLTLRRARRRP
jgi:LPXTG-motif cell wall-anchored protein